MDDIITTKGNKFKQIDQCLCWEMRNWIEFREKTRIDNQYRCQNKFYLYLKVNLPS